MKTTVTLFIFFTLFTVNAVAQDFTHTDFGLDEPLAFVEMGAVHSVAFSPDRKTLATGDPKSTYGMLAQPYIKTRLITRVGFIA